MKKCCDADWIHGDVLHLVGQEQPVGTGPRPPVGACVPEVEGEDPQRERREGDEDPRLEAVGPEPPPPPPR